MRKEILLGFGHKKSGRKLPQQPRRSAPKFISESATKLQIIF